MDNGGALLSLSPQTSAVELIELIEGIRVILLDGTLSAAAKSDLVHEWLRAFDVESGDLDRYSLFDDDKKYTRNLIATDGSTFTLMLLCWTPDKESPVHDHPCEGCWMRVVSGTVAETRYALTDAAGPVQTQFSTAAAPAVLYITDSIGLHKIGAVAGPARTLHLYSPPYRSCRIWPGSDVPSAVASVCVVTYFSEYGTIVDYGACTAGTGAGAVAAPGLCQ